MRRFKYKLKNTLFLILIAFLFLYFFEKENINKDIDPSNYNIYEYQGEEYLIYDIEEGDLSGYRYKQSAVDIGYGHREYFGLVNEYGQLEFVIADEIILQNEDNLINGRYFADAANVDGVEDPMLDKGHIIADSLGGVANAYNITPQNATLNRSGEQYDMEAFIRENGGCEDFIATIYYEDEYTNIPSKYNYKFVIDNQKFEFEFENK